MRGPETGGGAESRGGEGRIGWSPRQASPTELSINDEFTGHFLSLFGDSLESRKAASTLLQWTEEISKHEKDFSLLILGEPSDHLTRRYTLLNFGRLHEPLEVRVGRLGHLGDGGRLDVHLIFSADQFDRVVAESDEVVIFTGSNSRKELDVFKGGHIGVRPKVGIGCRRYRW